MKWTGRCLLPLLALLALTVSACAALPRGALPDSGSSESRGLPPAAPAPAANVAAPVAAQRAAQAPAAAQPAAPPSPVDTGERLIVKTGNLALLVDDVGLSTARARDLASSLNGFVVTANQHEENGRPAASITIRVPAERFDEAMDKLKGQAIRVGSEQVSSKDVTDQFVDTDARLRNLRATEQRYLDILQQAKTVDDVLKVEQQLSNIRGQIEQLQGQLQYLQRTAQTSTIAIELRPYVASQSQVFGWDPRPVLSQALSALVSTLQFLVGAAIWLTVFAPIWLPLILLVRRWRRGRAARRARQAPAT